MATVKLLSTTTVLCACCRRNQNGMLFTRVLLTTVAMIRITQIIVVLVLIAFLFNEISRL